MWNHPVDADVEKHLAEWMEAFAAEPIAQPPSASATEIWQKAELLRRWDAQRKAAAPIEMGDRAQVGVGLAGAVALLVWISRQIPVETMSPTLAAALVASVLLLVPAAAFSLWALLSRE
jgi:hypothetical protein